MCKLFMKQKGKALDSYSSAFSINLYLKMTFILQGMNACDNNINLYVRKVTLLSNFNSDAGQT